MHFKQMLRAMRLTVIFLVAASLQVSAEGFSQGISISEKNISLEKVFSEIKKQSPYTFTYVESTLAKAEKVSIHLKDATVEEVMNTCLKNQSLTYMIVDKTVVVRAKEGTVTMPKEIPPINVKGVVLNENKEPLEGISVTIKGTSKGISTNKQGEFEFTAIPDDAVLVITGVNIESFETKVNGRTSLQLTAKLKINKGQDLTLVSTGFQKIEKRRLIGDVTVVSGEEVRLIPVSGSFEKGLAGRVPGVYVRSNSGRPGESGSVQIRGINTLTGNREPLWVLDGMPLPTGEVSSSVNELLTRGLGNIPPEDIESITILKDATASAIYGSRSANGVIVITTKQGRSGKNYLGFSSRFSLSEKPKNKFAFMNTDEKIAFERSIFSDFKDSYGGRVVSILNSVEKGTITEGEGENSINELSKTNTDWMDVIMQNAFTQQYVLSLSGGNDKTQYYTSLNYSKANGTLKSNSYENAGMNMKISNYIRKDLLIRFNLYTTIKRNQEGQSSVDPFTYASFANPYEKPYNADGSYAADLTYVPTSKDVPDPYTGFDNFNILNELSKNTKTDSYGNARAQLGLEYKFLKNFRVTGTGAFNYSTVHTMDQAAPGTYRSEVNNWMKFVFPGITTSGIPDGYNNGYLREANARATDFTARGTLEYNKYIKKSFVQAMVAEEIGAGNNYQFDNLNPVFYPDSRIAGYPDMYTYFQSTRINLRALGGTSFSEQKNASFISSGSYTYDNRYVVNGSFRSDGVSILGNDNQFSPLWSVGGQWNMHNENFLKDNTVINRLVVRAGYGYRGSINGKGVYPFSYYNVNTAGSTYAGLLFGNTITYGNPVLSWEKKQNKDAAVEMSLFKGRLNAEVSYFNETVLDLLDQVQVPASSGRTATNENASSLRNQGFEFSVRGEVIKKKDFLWELSANITHYKNEVLATYYDNAPSQAPGGELNFNTRFVKGYAVDSWFGLKYSGIDPNTGHVMAWRKNKSGMKRMARFFIHTRTKKLM
jgi:TonB-linked SusC/RagA family outer membrane protein